MKRAVIIGAVVTVVLGAVIAAWLLREHSPLRERIERAAPAEEHRHAEDAPATGIDEEGRIPIDVSREQQARIGVRVARVTRRPVHSTIRAVGFVTPSERREMRVHTRIPGYVEDLAVDAVGDRVKRGQVLYRLYSPDVYATEHEYAAAAGRGELSASLARRALERLELWDVPPSEIARLRKTREPKRRIAFTSPLSGFVVEKPVLQGSYVTPEMELFRIADLSIVWVIVTLYEHELPMVAVGDPAEVSLASLPDRVIEGAVSYIYPDVDLATRTARARVEVPNGDFALKPGMYALVKLPKHLGDALVIPDDAVIFTGVRQIVFVQTDPTHFVPREIEVGPRVEAGRIIREGLEAGEDVVVRASFLIDAESRLKAALERGDAPAGHVGHGEPGEVRG